MAHKKAGGSTANVHDSPGQRLGVKLYDGEFAQAGAVLVRQRGTRILAGKGVSIGKDHTLFSVRPGFVKFKTGTRIRFDGRRKHKKTIDIQPEKSET